MVEKEPKVYGNRWRVERELGKGGQGLVYEVIDTHQGVIARERILVLSEALSEFDGTRANSRKHKESIERLVFIARTLVLRGSFPRGALKELLPIDQATNAKTAVERMKNEIATLKSVSHPALIKIFDDHIEERWFVTEYFSGGTLLDHLDIYKGRVLDALKAFRPIVDAVAELHRSGVVHRDIKPANVFVGETGLVLGDCGLAIRIDNQDRVTDTFENVGTRDYMPLWAHSMRLDEVKPTFDVYSLGKLLWAMVSARPHFPLWKFDENPHDLTTLFPHNHEVLFIHDVLKKIVVLEECDCKFNDAAALLQEVDTIIETLEGANAVPDLEHTILLNMLESQMIPESVEVNRKFISALRRHVAKICQSTAFAPIYKSEGVNGEGYFNYKEDEPSKTESWTGETFPHMGIPIFRASGVEIYALRNRSIFECSVVRRDYDGPNDPSTQSYNFGHSITREGQEYSIESFIEKLTPRQKRHLLSALASGQIELHESWLSDSQRTSASR